MYRGRYSNRTAAQPKCARKKPAKRRKLNKYFLVTLSLLLLFGIAAGGSLAYVIKSTDGLSNRFVPGEVACAVDSNYAVTNVGNVSAYIRAAVAVNWENGKGEFKAIAPVRQIRDENGNITTPGDYELSLGEDWLPHEDGYYYYQKNVAVDGVTTPVVTIIPVNPQSGEYRLAAEVVTEAIQAEGMGADVDTAQEAWDVARNG